MISPRSFRSAAGGFSLVEVMLALGVISFAIVSLLGLLTVSSASSRYSEEDTAIAAIARQVDTELRNTLTANLPTAGATWYFDNDGKHLLSAGDSIPIDAIYRCEISLTGDPTYDSTTATNGSATNLYRLQLLVSYAARRKTTDPQKSYVLQTLNTALYRND